MRVRIAALTTLMLFLIMGLVLINGCGGKEEKQPSEKGGEKKVVEKGNIVKVRYTARLKDGTVFDKSKEGAPLEFTVGSGQIIPGLDKAVEGMELNEEKKVTIEPADAYGKRNETLKREFPKSSLPENFKPEKGMVIKLQDQNGKPVPVKIIDITENNITVDLNHPLAGEVLTFDITVVGIE